MPRQELIPSTTVATSPLHPRSAGMLHPMGSRCLGRGGRGMLPAYPPLKAITYHEPLPWLSLGKYRGRSCWEPAGFQDICWREGREHPAAGDAAREGVADATANKQHRSCSTGQSSPG